MQQIVLVREHPIGHFQAEAMSFPDIRAEADSEAEAVEKVRDALAARLRSAKFVTIDVPANGHHRNPWLDLIGSSANDPEFAEYVSEIKQAREADPAE